MTRELKSVSTEELRAEYVPQFEKLKSLRSAVKQLEADIAPLRDELVERDNKSTLVLNAVMSGQQGLLRATGMSEEAISQAESVFAAMKSAKEAARKESMVA